jgi:vacuolar-type H+-ATPase subunit I/STV1
MGIDSGKVAKLISEYYELHKILQNPKIEEDTNFQKYYNEELYLASTLGDIVLTASEFVEKGIVKQILSEIKPKERTSSKKKENIYKQSISTLGRKYKELGRKYEKLKKEYKKLEDECQYDDEEIKAIINGKQGSIIDEIRAVLEE